HCQSGDYPRASLLRDGVLDGASGGRSRAPVRPAEVGMPESLAGDCGEVAPVAAAGGAGRAPVRRLDADVRRIGGPGADGDTDSRRRHRRWLRFDAFSLRVLGSARSLAGRLSQAVLRLILQRTYP